MGSQSEKSKRPASCRAPKTPYVDASGLGRLQRAGSAEVHQEVHTDSRAQGGRLKCIQVSVVAKALAAKSENGNSRTEGDLTPPPLSSQVRQARARQDAARGDKTALHLTSLVRALASIA